MNSQIMSKSAESFSSELKECGKLLVEKLESDNYEEASQLIHGLIESRDNQLFTLGGAANSGLAQCHC